MERTCRNKNYFIDFSTKKIYQYMDIIKEEKEKEIHFNENLKKKSFAVLKKKEIKKIDKKLKYNPYSQS